MVVSSLIVTEVLGDNPLQVPSAAINATAGSEPLPLVDPPVATRYS